ncbi:MAG: hypothetical protein RL112_2700 [Planctomycetota bacterium]|jgi:hypothetical protein
MRLPLVLTIALVASAFAPAEEVLKPADHASLGKSLQAWVKANEEVKGTDKALEELSKEVDKLNKKAKRDVLSLPSDIGRAIWSSYDYSKGRVVKGKIAKEELAAYWDEKAKLSYAVWTPAKYDPKLSYPLLLCLPDAKQKPDQHLLEDWMDPSLRDKAILVSVALPEDAASWTADAVSSSQSGTRNLTWVFSKVAKSHAIDFDRVYLCGRGASVGLALLVASRYPDRFAGVVGRSGDAIAVVGENFRNLPTLLCGAGANATAFGEANEKLGYKNCTIKVDGTEADVWAWMGVTKRTAYPVDVALWPGLPAPRRAYWLETSWDGQGTAWLKANCNRSTNTITITGEGVTKVTLYFNDVLLDLDKPVKVVCNGIESTSTIPRRLRDTVEFMRDGRNDPGKVFVNAKVFDLPPPKKEDAKAGTSGK